MADFAGLRGSLARLRADIQQRLPGVLMGRPNSDAEAERRSDELAKFADRVTLLRRDLKSHENLLAMHRHDPHTAAGWAARQRLQDLLSVQQEAEDLANLINDLMRRNGLNVMQAVDKSHELLENLENCYSHAEVSSALKAAQQLQQTIGPATGHAVAHMEPLAAFDTAVPLLAFSCLLLRWGARSLKEKR
jgi:hypothetical protein